MRHALDLFSFSGSVSRKAYLAAGVALAIVKYPIDWLVSAAFDRPWHPLLYFSLRVTPLLDREAPREWLLALGAVALPFLAAGLSLSVRRLRDMGVSPFWAGVFLFPYLHWAFILVLVVCPAAKPVSGPEHPYRDGPAPEAPRDSLLSRLIPVSLSGAFLLGLVLSETLGMFGYIIGTHLSARLGFTFFLGVPFAMGFVMGFCTSFGGPSFSAGRAALRSMVPILAGYLILVAIGEEGVACMVMASPLTLGTAALGGVLGKTAAASPRLQVSGFAAVLILCPASAGFDQVAGRAPVEVGSCVDVHASPDAVWRALDAGAPLDAPPDPLFALVAMPVGVRVDRRSARVRFDFSNGTFEGRVTSASAHEVAIEVDQEPQQLSPYVETIGGSFVMRPTPRGVRLCARTDHRVNLRPLVYWERWTQGLVKTVQRRILAGVRDAAESRAPVRGEIPAWMAAAHETCPCTRAHAP